MRVRDRTLRVSEYKGRPTDACDAWCPCRPCYNAHDCGHYVHSGPGKTEWRVKMECAVRYNNGCPHDDEGKLPKPIHVKRSVRSRVCARCGVVLPKDYPLWEHLKEIGHAKA